MLIRSRENPDGPPIAIHLPLEGLREKLLALYTRDPLALGVREALFVVEQGQRWNASHDDPDRRVGSRRVPIRRGTCSGFSAYNTGDFLREFGRREDLPDAVREVVRLVRIDAGDIMPPQPHTETYDPQTLAPFIKPRPRVEIREVPPS